MDTFRYILIIIRFYAKIFLWSSIDTTKFVNQWNMLYELFRYGTSNLKRFGKHAENI
jgi:hypothetical protein